MAEPRARLRAVGLVCLPFLALLAAGAAAQSIDYAARNDYLSHGLALVAAAHLRDRVLRALLYGLPLLVLVAPAALARPTRAVLATGLLAELCWGAALLAYGGTGTALVGAWGLPVPSGFRWAWREFSFFRAVPLGLVAIAALGGAGALAIAVRARRRPAAPIPVGADRASAACGVALAAILGLSSAAPAVLRPSPPGPRHHVVLASWDSLRADRISPYDPSRRTTPHLAALAAAAVVFDQATAQHNWTRPSYSSLLTSRHMDAAARNLTLADVTLAEILRGAGYRTLGFVQNPYLDPSLVFDQGFDTYRNFQDTRSARRVNEAVLGALASLDPSHEPIFLFVHYLRPHFPYPHENPHLRDFLPPGTDPPGDPEVTHLMGTHGQDWDASDPDSAVLRELLLGMYDATVRQTDEVFGALLAALDRTLDLDRTLVVFHSDHGEEFLEHGSFGHGHENLHAELVRVPLIVRFPRALGIPAGRVSAPAAYLDLLPTVLDVLQLPAPVPLAGRSLVPLARGERPRRAIASSSRRQIAVRDARFKLLRDLTGDAAPRLYDLAADPDEQRPLPHPERHPAYAALEREADRLAAALRGADAPDAEAPQLAESLRRQLRALGYAP